MEEKQFIELLREELPGVLRRDRGVREWVLEVTRGVYAEQGETESRFDRLLEELRQDREEQARKWAEQERKWEENQQALRQRQEEESRRWVEQERKWEENQQALRRMQDTIDAQVKKHDSSIGALGARWGLYSEQAFRRGLEGILTASFGVQVLNVTEYDDAGEVFGRPDQVELDVVIQDGMLILMEIKSSISKAEMYTFYRKVAFYEKRHGRQAGRKLVISPMVDEGARGVAEQLGIEVYSHAEESMPGGSRA